MTSAREALDEQLEADPFLRDALDRGIVNARGLAEWLVENRDLEHSEDALAHHIRKAQGEASGFRLERARETLAGTDLEARSGLTAFEIPLVDHVQQRLSRLLGELDVDSGDQVALVTGERAISLVVAGDRAGLVRDVLGGDLVDDERDGLVQLRLAPGRDGSDARVLGLVVEALTTQGIDVVGAHSGASGDFVLLEETDRAPALRALGRAAAD